MRRLILPLLLALAWMTPVHAQQLHIYCNVAMQTPCTPTSLPLSTAEQVVTGFGKTEANFDQWYGVTGIVKGNGSSAAPAAAATSDLTGVINVTGIPVLSPTTAAAAAASDVANTVGGLLQPQTSAESSASVTPVSLGWPVGHVFRYMTAAQISDVTSGTHSLDDAGAFTNALAVGGTITVPAFTYRLASGITVAPGALLSGTWAGPSSPGVGTVLQCDLSVATCVTVGGALAALNTAGLQGVVVTRASGTIPASSIGVLVLNGYNPTLNHVMSYRHSIGFEFQSSVSTAGIAAQVDNLFTGAITDAHLVQNGWAELRIVNSRFGSNGSADVSCNTFIRETGGSTNPAGGPNTLFVANTQFNQGANNATYWMEWTNQTSGATSDMELWQFVNVYVETIGTAYLFSDSTWNNVERLKFANVQLSSSVEFYALNAATAINEWQLANSFFSGTFTISPTAQMNYLMLANDKFSSAASVTGVSNSTFDSVGNQYAGGATFAGNFSRLSSAGDAGSLTDTSTATTKSIASGGLLSATGGGTIGGVVQFTNTGSTGALQVISSGPNLGFDNNTAPANAGWWRWTEDNTGALSLQSVNDAFNSTTTAFSSTRSGLALGTLTFGNGTAAYSFPSTGTATFAGIVTAPTVKPSSNIIAAGTTFSASGCSISAHSGGAFAGQYTSGTAGTCAVTITLPTTTTAYTCWASDTTTPADSQVMSASTSTGATITGTTASGDVVKFGCIGY